MEIINYPYFFNERLIATSLIPSDLVLIGRKDKEMEGGYRTYVGKAEDLFPTPPTPYVKPYKSIVMKLRQTGVAVPTIVSIAENDFGEIPTFIYDAAGQYEMVFASNWFPDADKVYFFQKSLGRMQYDSIGKKNTLYFVDPQWNDVNNIILYTSFDGGDFADDCMYMHDLEIRVYS